MGLFWRNSLSITGAVLLASLVTAGVLLSLPDLANGELVLTPRPIAPAAGVLAAMLGIIIWFMVARTRRMSRTLGQFDQALKQAAQGDLGAEISIDFGNSLNAMVDNLKLLTSQFQAEIAMRYRLTGATDHMLDGLVILDSEGQILQTNRVAEGLLGKPLAALTGQPIAGFLAEDSKEKNSGLVSRLVRARGIMLATGRIIPTTISAMPLTSPLSGQREIVCIIRDQSATEVHEHDLQDIRDQAQEAVRVKAEFLDNINHELRTPLNAVIGFSEMFQNETFGPLGHEKYADYANQIHRSGLHLLAIINDIMELSRNASGKQELHYEEVSPGDLARSAVSITDNRAWEKDVSMGLILDKDLPGTVRVDDSALKRVLTHLLRNAVQHTEARGTVTLIVGRSGPDLEIIVEDTGCGMTLDEIAEALKPFRQANNAHTRSHDGPGLGLPVSKQLVEMHGGSLRIASTPGQGTQVILRIPTSPPEHLIKAA